jgi:uncharacterized protein YdeI (YjbR/CyaY-like superfamily)
MPAAPRPRHFASQASFRRWLEQNHARATELWVGFYKKSSGKGGITYREALDEALCFGWIDGIRKSVDDVRFVQRFTPRRAGSYWSQINIVRMKELEALGSVAPAGRKAFEGRDERAAKYSYEQRRQGLGTADLKTFRANTKAWTFFSSQPPGYQRLAGFFVTSAKKDETRTRRLATLIKLSAEGRRMM